MRERLVGFLFILSLCLASGPVRAQEASGSRLEQLARAKAAGVKIPMLMIRVPMLSELDEMVKVCEYSLQSEYSALKALDDAEPRKKF